MLFKKVNIHKKITNIFDAMDKLNKCERKFSIILCFLLNQSVKFTFTWFSSENSVCVCTYYINMPTKFSNLNH